MTNIKKSLLTLILTFAIILGAAVIMTGCDRGIAITYNLNGGQNNKSNPKYYKNKEIELKDPVNMGYVFEGWYESNDYSGKQINKITSLEKSITLHAKWEYDSSFYDTFPVISISTNNVEIKNKTDYVDASFNLFNVESDYELEFAEVSSDVGIRLRGNSTMKQIKKPYRIKFNKKQSLFGLDKNKSWVLLADYLDPTSLRNHTAFNVATKFDNIDFKNHAQHVVLYLNNQYQGLYLFSEHVDAKEGRVDVEQDLEGLENDYPFLVEMDHLAHKEGTPGVDNFTISPKIKHVEPIEIKYPKAKDRNGTPGNDKIFDYIEEYMTAVFQTLYLGEKVTVSFRKEKVGFSDLVDVDTFIDYYLINEIMHNRDSVWKSVKIHKAVGGKVKFGPVWDFDYSAVVTFTDKVMYTEISEYDKVIMLDNSIFKYYVQDENNMEKVINRFNEIYSSVLSYFENDLQAYQTQLKNIAINDAKRWYPGDAQTIIEKEFEDYKTFLIKRLNHLKSKVFNNED